MAIKAEFGLSLFGFDLIIPVRRKKVETKVEKEVVSVEESSCNRNDGKDERAVFRFDTKIEETAGHTVRAEIFNGHSVSDENKRRDREQEQQPAEPELIVIDVNYFPSYKEVPDFPHRFRKFLRERAGMLPSIAD